jgi:hypothetical protein
MLYIVQDVSGLLAIMTLYYIYYSLTIITYSPYERYSRVLSGNAINNSWVLDLIPRFIGYVVRRNYN